MSVFIVIYCSLLIPYVMTVLSKLESQKIILLEGSGNSRNEETKRNFLCNLIKK